LKTVFQASPEKDDSGVLCERVVLVLQIEDAAELHTAAICDLQDKMETAFPGIFTSDSDAFAHMCGIGEGQHDFRAEIEEGTTVPHLLEHVILHIIGRSSGKCSGFTGQRSSDIERGITDLHYIVTDCPDRLQAVVATDLALHVVQAWLAGRTVRLDRRNMVDSLHDRLQNMLMPEDASLLN
jgi:hypothetical protein